MNPYEKLEMMLKENKGILRTQDVTKEEIPRVYLMEFVRRNSLERFSRGIFLSKEAYADSMYLLQSSYSQAVFSHDTALFLHDLTDREPIEYNATVKAGYNARYIIARGVKVYKVKKDLYELGLIEMKTPFGRIVKTYNLERTICDIVRSRSNIEAQTFQNALRNYVVRKDKNLPLLMRYAKKFRIENVLKKYLEVIL